MLTIKQIIGILRLWMLKRAPRRKPTTRVLVNVKVGKSTSKGVSIVQITDSQQFTITLVPEDAKGNPSAIDPTKTTFTATPATLATLTPASDGLNCLVVAQGVGSGQIQFSVTDATNSSDVVSGTLALTIVGGQTAQLVANTSAPVSQPNTPPTPTPQQPAP